MITFFNIISLKIERNYNSSLQNNFFGLIFDNKIV
jgi:hypothetical protein